MSTSHYHSTSFFSLLRRSSRPPDGYHHPSYRILILNLHSLPFFQIYLFFLPLTFPVTPVFATLYTCAVIPQHHSVIPTTHPAIIDCKVDCKFVCVSVWSTCHYLSLSVSVCLWLAVPPQLPGQTHLDSGHQTVNRQLSTVNCQPACLSPAHSPVHFFKIEFSIRLPCPLSYESHSLAVRPESLSGCQWSLTTL